MLSLVGEWAPGDVCLPLFCWKAQCWLLESIHLLLWLPSESLSSVLSQPPALLPYPLQASARHPGLRHRQSSRLDHGFTRRAALSPPPPTTPERMPKALTPLGPTPQELREQPSPHPQLGPQDLPPALVLCPIPADLVVCRGQGVSVLTAGASWGC